MLEERGIFTRAEFNEAFTKRYAHVNPRAKFDSLLDLLVSKGVISEDERRKLSE